MGLLNVNIADGLLVADLAFTAFPPGWPPRVPTGIRSLRFRQAGTATANFSDSAYLFADQASANPFTPLPYVAPGAESQVVTLGVPPIGSGQNAKDSLLDPRIGTLVAAPPHPMIWSSRIRILVLNNVTVEISFDGTNVHGKIPGSASGAEVIYRNRYEAGISIRGNTAQFVIEAW